MDSANGRVDDTVRVDFTLAIGPGRLEASVHVPRNEVSLTQIIPAIRELTSNIVGSVVEIVQSEGRQISCKAGCAACCRHMVPLSLFEAEALAEWIAALPENQQELLRQRFHAALLALKEHGILSGMDSERWADGSEALRRLGVDYLAAKVPCPFLVNESCAIYPIRPLVCREYLVTSPPEFCAMPTVDVVEGVPMPLKPSQSLFRLGAQIEEGGRGWIPLVFLLAWMKSGAKPGSHFFGPGPNVLYTVVQNLTVSGAPAG